MSKKDFVNVFHSPYDKKTLKVTSLFKIDKIKTYIKEGQRCEVTVNIKVKPGSYDVVRQMLTSDDLYKVAIKGIDITAGTNLHANDVWSEQKGTDIAEHKALAKAYNLIESMLYKKQLELEAKATSLHHIGIKFLEKRDKQLACAEKIGGK